MAFLQNLVAPTAQATQAPIQRAPTLSYAGIEEVATKRQYIPSGFHLLEVIQCEEGFLPETSGGNQFFGASLKILASDNVNARVGTEVSWMARKGQYARYFLRDIKEFLAAVGKVDAAVIGPGAPKEAAGQQNPLRGMKVLAEGYDSGRVTKKGEMIVDVRFAPYNEPAAQ